MIDMVFNEAVENGEEFLAPVETWNIENDQEADWAIKKIKEAEGELDRWRRYYATMLAKVEKNTERTVAFMTVKLREYFNGVPHKESKTQEKYGLPSGELVMKKAKTVWEHDDSALMDWVKENGFSDCVKVTEKISWEDVKKRLTVAPDGSIVDGETGVVCNAVTQVQKDPIFEVKRT